MLKEYKGIYIDVNRSVEVCVRENEGKLEVNLICDPSRKNDKGYQNYVSNISRILKCEYHIDSNGKIEGIDVLLGKLRVGTISQYQRFGQINRESGEYQSEQLLTTTEERILSQGSIPNIEKFNVPFDRTKTKTPKTDLHTHLSGALKSEDMLSIGKKFNCLIPVSLLEKAGIDVNKYKSVFHFTKEYNKKTNQVEEGLPKVYFNDLTPEDVEVYKQRLSIKINAQETFVAMDDCYDFRDPFVKLKSDFFDKSVDLVEVFKEQLRCLARHYQKTGVQYAELSTSDICKSPASFSKMLDQVMPEIEKEFPDVHFKFLGGIPRVLSKESMNMRNKNLLASAKSPHIVGLDIMAHEVNETDHFKHVIQDCVEYANKKDSNFVIRVHAGESAVHHDNIKQFLKIVKDSLIPGMKPPVIRIGHGIHGIDKETMGLCKELGAVVEINMSSNIALNNIDSLKEIAVKKYIDEGLKVCFGTDGHGMYSTDARQEAVLATAAGVTVADMDKVVENEERYIDRMLDSAKKKKEASVEEKFRYLVRLSDRIKDIIKSSNIKNVQDLANVVSSALKDPLKGRMIEIEPEEIVVLIESGILKLDEKTAKGMSFDQKGKMVLNMPNSYYEENYSMDTAEKKALDRKCEEERSEEQTKSKNAIESFLGARKQGGAVIESDMDKPIPAIDGKKPIFIMGYLSQDWKKLSSKEKTLNIANAVEFVSALDPQKTYIVTNCEDGGFNKVLHDIIKKVNPKIAVHGIIDASQVERISPKQKEWIYDKFDNVKIEKGHMFTHSNKLVDFINEQDGQMVAFGEGSQLKDHLTNMHNGSGKSTKIEFFQGNGYEFSNFSTIASRLRFAMSNKTHLTKEERKSLIMQMVEEYVLKQEKEGHTPKIGSNIQKGDCE